MFFEKCSWHLYCAQRRTLELLKASCFQHHSESSSSTGLCVGFWVSTLPSVQDECAVLDRKIIPNSSIQLSSSVLMEAVAQSGTKDWGIPNESTLFSTTDIVAWAPVLVTGFTIKKQENAKITKRQWSLRLLGGWKGPLWSMWIVRNGTVSFCQSSNGTSFLCSGFGLLFWQVKLSAVSAHIR